MAVMQAESGCTPEAFNGKNRNGSNDAGLFQINSIHVKSGLISDQARFDPESNVRAAFAIYKGSGWKAWSSYNAGKHIKFM
jgi:soluble lytic murein transglycosylase-like protein